MSGIGAIRAASAAALLAVVALALVGCVPTAQPDHGNVVPTARPKADVFSLQIGECVERASAQRQVKTVPGVPCSTPHDGEVYDVMTIPGDAYPGAAKVHTASVSGCQSAFASFAGISYQHSTHLSYWWLFPTEMSWSHGDHSVVCFIDELGKNSNVVKNTGTLRDAKR